MLVSKMLIQIIFGFFIVGSAFYAIRVKSKSFITPFGVYVILISTCYSLPWILAKLTGSFTLSVNMNNGQEEIVDLGWVQPFIYPLADILALVITIIYLVLNVTRQPILNLRLSVWILACIPALSIISRLINQNQIPNGQPILIILFICAIASSNATMNEVISVGSVITLFSAWLSAVFVLVIPEYALVKCPTKCTIFGSLESGSASHYNQLGMAMALGFSLVWFNFSGWWRIFFVSFNLLTLYLSGSRSSYLSVALQISVALLLTKRKYFAKTRDGRYAFGTFLALCTLLIATLIPFQDHDDHFATGRGYLWRIAITYFNDSPFIGQGAKFWTDRYALGLLSKAAVYSPHNLFLDILLLSGAVGGIIFLITIVSWIKRISRLQEPFALTLLLGTLSLSILESPLSFSYANSTSWFLIVILSVLSLNFQGKVSFDRLPRNRHL